MADATTEADCIARHVAYPYDIAGRLNAFQRARVTRMVAPIRPGEAVLDVGCNSGYLVDYLPPQCRCFGVDVAPGLIQAAHARLYAAQVAPAERLPFVDHAMDVVVLGEILEHVFDPVAVVREAARVARRLVVGSTPHEASRWGPRQSRGPEAHQFHVRCFTEATLRETCRDCASVQIEILTWDGQPAFYVFAATVP